MKIKLSGLCFFCLLFSACGDLNSGSSEDNNGDSNGGNSQVTITQPQDVPNEINQAREVVTAPPGGATSSVTLLCDCGEDSVRGQGENESKAREAAQKICNATDDDEEESSPAVLSNCEQATAGTTT